MLISKLGSLPRHLPSESAKRASRRERFNFLNGDTVCVSDDGMFEAVRSSTEIYDLLGSGLREQAEYEACGKRISRSDPVDDVLHFVCARKDGLCLVLKISAPFMMFGRGRRPDRNADVL